MTCANTAMKTPAMWPWGNKHVSDFVIIGNPGNRRVELFQAALYQLGLPAARLVSYADLIAGRAELDVQSRSVVRIESPGKDFEVERTILRLGAECEDVEGDYWRLGKEQIDALNFDKGRILPSRQWYLGFCRVLDQIEGQLNGCALMNAPADIKMMFDKRACHARLEFLSIGVPASFPPITCYDELIHHMRGRQCWRVFIKLAHGSSASGVVAYRSDGNRHQAITTVEMVRHGNTMRLYNSRRVRTCDKPGEIAELIDALCKQRVHVEQWIPKAGIANQSFDLRVVVIAGQAQHVVVRLSRTPMTNLHLLNARGDVDQVLERIGPIHWDKARQTCEQAASAFNSLYSGIDLLISSDYKRHAIAEINAFGDLLPGVLHNGQDTYSAEILAMLERVAS
jgi:hypothetical protein